MPDDRPQVVVQHGKSKAGAGKADATSRHRVAKPMMIADVHTYLGLTVDLVDRLADTLAPQREISGLSGSPPPVIQRRLPPIGARAVVPTARIMRNTVGAATRFVTPASAMILDSRFNCE